MSWLSRARQTVWASAVVAALAGGSLGPFSLLHAGFDDDPACTGSAATGTGSTEGLRFLAGSPASPEHCAVCHWLHLLRTVAPSDRVAEPASPDAGDLVYHRNSAPAAVWSFPSSGRSPPPSVR